MLGQAKAVVLPAILAVIAIVVVYSGNGLAQTGSGNEKEQGDAEAPTPCEGDCGRFLSAELLQLLLDAESALDQSSLLSYTVDAILVLLEKLGLVECFEPEGNQPSVCRDQTDGSDDSGQPTTGDGTRDDNGWDELM